MRVLRNVCERISRVLTPGVIAALTGAFFLLTLLPILYVAPAVRATGDDLGYSYVVHDAMLAGEGLSGMAAAVAGKVISTWYSWQGTWSSVALFCLQPGIWGDEWYPVTVAVALLCLVCGTWYLLHAIFRQLGFAPAFRWTACFLTAVLLIQYMPYPRGGIFWWTSVAHYCIPYGAATMCMGWSLRWLETGGKRFYAGVLLAMIYLGGAGYPALVLGAVWTFLLAAGSLAGGRGMKSAARSRQALLFVPLLLEMAGFAVSAAAPGNINRGGEGFGFSPSNVGYTLITCLKDGLTGGAAYFLTVRPLLPVLLIIAVFAWELAPAAEGDGVCSRFLDGRYIRQPLLLLAAGVVISCLVRAPEIYAGTEVSGGVPDTYWFVTLTAMIICTAGVSAWMRNRLDRNGRKVRTHFASAVFAVICGVCLLLSRYLIGATVDYTCVNYVVSGAFADYKEQMGEWLALLQDPELDEVELPAMNDEQGPFMLMVPLEESGSFTNSVYEDYYGKSSVIMVPRDS